MEHHMTASSHSPLQILSTPSTWQVGAGDGSASLSKRPGSRTKPGTKIAVLHAAGERRTWYRCRRQSCTSGIRRFR